MSGLGKVLNSYGGKSLSMVLGIAGGMAGLGLVALIVGAMMREYFMPAVAVSVLMLIIAIMYVATNLVGVFTKAEVCQGGIRITGLKGTKEIAWDEIDHIAVGRHRLNDKLRWAVTIYHASGEQTDLSPEFWDSAGGTTTFIATVRPFTSVEMV
ncbi:MAG TPA: hypothetical protein VFV87_19575 [Pirellulaceae bacterium]|nr:hypothetical protein [Pirellulaceae bacterium]